MPSARWWGTEPSLEEVGEALLSDTLLCEDLELGVTMMGEEAEVEGAMAAYVLEACWWSKEAGAWGAGTGV